MESPERTRWYALLYRTAYVLHLNVWDRTLPPPVLVELIEGPSRLPPRRALDLGCGGGTEAIYLARHGWDVTGVDLMPRALAIARRRAARAGVSPRFLVGDTTRLRESGVGADYDLLVDYGCYHTLPADRRDAYADGVSEAAAPGATYLLLGFANPRFPMQAGVSANEVRARFSSRGWEVVRADRLAAAAIPPLKLRAQVVAAHFGLWAYRLRRPVPDGTSAR
jgi:SAM-dependent methyltransferase